MSVAQCLSILLLHLSCLFCSLLLQPCYAATDITFTAANTVHILLSAWSSAVALASQICQSAFAKGLNTCILTSLFSQDHAKLDPFALAGCVGKTCVSWLIRGMFDELENSPGLISTAPAS